MRGFKDRQTDLETFAGTASRVGQRLVNSIGAQYDDFVLFSFDVSQAFAKGMPFEELSKITGEPLRAVEFDLRGEDVDFLRLIPGFEDFNPSLETLEMIKPIYGLKDAPRAWRKRLHQAMTKGRLKQLHAEPEIYTRHTYKALENGQTAITGTDRMDKLRQREVDAGNETASTYSTGRKRRHSATLEMILSTHVDDLKGAATRKAAEELLKCLEGEFGKCKAEWQNFMHTGIQHERRQDGIYAHQHSYVKAIKPMSLDGIKKLGELDTVDDLTHNLYRKILGEVAWTMLTRADLAVYVQALQRRGAKPRVVDCRRINLVVRYLKRHATGIFYPKLAQPWRLVGISDSAFRAQEDESTGLALRGLTVLLSTDDTNNPTSPNGLINLIDFIVRRLRRVVRSTFSAELNALIDAIETLILTQLAMHQVIHGTNETADELLQALEDGQLDPPIDVVIDARSVFDSLAVQDVCNPAEMSLELHLIAIRAKLESGLLRNLYWCDTRDMLADGLTKGGIDRTMLIKALDKGQYTLQHPVVKCGKK